MKFKKIICIVSAIMLLLPVLLIPVSADNYVNLDTSPVEADLLSLLGKDELDKLILDQTAIQEDGSQVLSVVYCLEHGFDSMLSDWSQYGLYLYIYNPSGMSLASNTGNNVSLQIDLLGGGKSDVVKYNLDLISFSENKTLLKFKLSNISTNILMQMNVSERGYHIVGMEIRFTGNEYPKEYDLSASFYFNGFNAGCDTYRTNNDTLRQRYKQLETVEVELHPTSWMSDTSELGEGYKYEVSGVYFAIPNYYLHNYGNWDGDDELNGLYSVSGVYKESRINGLVTDNQQVYSHAKMVAGKSIQWYNANTGGYLSVPKSEVFRNDFPLSFWDPIEVVMSPQPTGRTLSYNEYVGTWRKSYKVIDKICIPILSSTESDITADVVAEKLIEYDGVNYRNVDVDNGRIYGNQVYKITADDVPMGFTQYDYSQDHPFLSWIMNAGIKNDVQANVEWLQKIDLDFLDSFGINETASIAQRYYIGEGNVTGLRSVCNSNAVQNGLLDGISGSTVYLMHFAKTDYYTTDVEVALTSNDTVFDADTVESNTYYYERTVFENFDILQFTFIRENGNYTIIPVIASPVTITGGLSAPADPNGNSSNPGTADPGPSDAIAGCRNTYGDLNQWAKLAVLLLGAVILVFALGIFKPILQLIGWLLGAIVKIFTGGAKAIATLFSAKEKTYEAKRKRIIDHEHDTDYTFNTKEKNYDADRKRVKDNQNDEDHSFAVTERKYDAQRKRMKNKESDEEHY